MKKIFIIIILLLASTSYSKERMGLLAKKELDSYSKEIVEIIINGSLSAQAEIFFSPSGKAFLKLLPLTITSDDYNSSEKLGYIDSSLDTKGMVNNHYAKAGDITYYSPWKSISIFYKDYGITKDLYPIGKITSGLDKISNQKTKFILTIRRKE